VLHQGLLTITGRAPDELTFVRDGKQLVDARSTIERNATELLRADTNATRDARSTSASAANRSRFDDVVKLEHAKQALMQLGFKARAARAALDAACAYVGADADVAMLVKTVLDQQRADLGRPTSADDLLVDAEQALSQLGYSRAVARAAVEAASAHVGATAELATLIKEALRRCGSS
jgi:Holliday junction resolvasome RuvABC DNA-binding subunit